jgi:predicted DNA-binding WGR domain protein
MGLDAMDNLRTLTPEGHNAAQNHHRRYELSIGRDLFDDWTITIRYGRVGRGGYEQRYGSHEMGPLRAIIRKSLQRRLSAPRRIGCSYRLTSFTRVEGFDSAGWLRDDVMESFAGTPAPAGR